MKKLFAVVTLAVLVIGIMIWPAGPVTGDDGPPQYAKVSQAFSVGKGEAGHRIAEGSTVYHLKDGTTEVHEPGKGRVLVARDSEANLVETPNGKRRATHVLSVPNGAVIEGDEATTVIYENMSAEKPLLTIVDQTGTEVPGPVGGWLAQARDLDVDTLSRFRADWTVPAAPPAPAPDIVNFYFNGIQPEGMPTARIIQPVLQWNQFGLRNKWTGESWYAAGVESIHVNPIDCSVGDSITGTMSKFWSGVDYYWWVCTRNNATGQQSEIYVEESKVPFQNLEVFCVLEGGKDTGPYITDPGQLPGSCFFQNMAFNDGPDAVDIQWETGDDLVVDDLVGVVSVTSDPTQNDDSWVTIWTPNDNPQATADISVTLQGSNRPDPAGWEVPLTVKLFSPGADVVNDSPLYEFAMTTVKSGDYAVCTVSGITPGTYDVTAVSEHTLMNVKRDVVVSAPSTAVDMGTLLEGNCNDDNEVGPSDFMILRNSWLLVEGDGGFDSRADLNRDGEVGPSDFMLMRGNWLSEGPLEI